MQMIAVLPFGLLFLAAAVAATESDYRKYLRTRPPRLPGEVHVEEVLEVFRSRSRPSPYGVYNPEVNAFLANEFLQARRRSTTTAPTTTTSTSAPPRPTYPSTSKDNTNPDYSDLFRPSISMTKYPSYVPPKSMIIIKEAGPAGSSRNLQPTVPMAKVLAADQGTEVDYSNEEYYLEPL